VGIVSRKGRVTLSKRRGRNGGIKQKCEGNQGQVRWKKQKATLGEIKKAKNVFLGRDRRRKRGNWDGKGERHKYID